MHGKAPGEEMPHLLDAANKAGLQWCGSLSETPYIRRPRSRNTRPLSEAGVDRELVRIAKKLNALFVKSDSAKESQVEGPQSGIEEVNVQNSLLDQIACKGRISRDDSRQAEVIASFGTGTARGVMNASAINLSQQKARCGQHRLSQTARMLARAVLARANKKPVPRF